MFSDEEEEVFEARPGFLSGSRAAMRLERADAGSSAVAELLKYAVFCAAWFALCRVVTGHLWLSILLAYVLGLFSLLGWNSWRADRELGELAWQQWMDRCRALAAQRGLQVGHGVKSERAWRDYFDRKMSPERAVADYREKSGQ